MGFDDAIASTLVASLIDVSPIVRRSAVEAIEQAVHGTKDLAACRSGRPGEVLEDRIRLLYGDSGTDVRGVLTRHLASLEQSGVAYLGTDGVSVETAIQAAKDGLRKNWECLRHANFRGLDLTGLELFEANLQHADLRETTLDWVDLRGSDLSDALFLDARQPATVSVRSTRFANVANLRGVPDFKKWALAHGAVEMTAEQYRMWRIRWQGVDTTLSIDWPRWSESEFKIDEYGCPITRDGSLLTSCPTAATGPLEGFDALTTASIRGTDQRRPAESTAITRAK